MLGSSGWVPEGSYVVEILCPSEMRLGKVIQRGGGRDEVLIRWYGPWEDEKLPNAQLLYFYNPTFAQIAALTIGGKAQIAAQLLVKFLDKRSRMSI